MRNFLRSLMLCCLFIGFRAAHSQTLIHYWNFNTTSSYAAHLTPAVSNVPGAAIDTFLYSGPYTSLVDYQNGTGQDFGTNNYNTRNGDAAGTHLRFNNPIYGALRFSLPTTGYKDVVVKYTSLRSGSGAYLQYIDYTTDGTNYTRFDTIDVTTTATLFTFDFTGITNVNNNADFKIRITFAQGGGGQQGNNRIDNFTLDATSISGGDVVAPTVVFDPLHAATNVAVNVNPTFTFSEDVRLSDNSALDNNNVDTIIEVRLGDSAGALVPFNAGISGKVITVVPNAPLLNNQVYYVALKANVVEDLADNAITTTQSFTFTTIALQTIFAAGDLVPVAYRMSAASTDDEIAFLTLVNILPGTLINFTDGKYTDNTVAQCPGGFTWKAPASGVAAGTVISIKNDALTSNTGTLTGSGFGLSSSGDQVIVYTGTNTAPNYITAFSSNAWLSANTSCSGSNSKLPAGLTDKQTSISFAAAKGSVSGNTANAYYAGPMAGTATQLKAWILDTVNWIGAIGGSAPQSWPIWAFPGPPAVTSVKVLSSNSLQVIFNRDLDAVSATDVANFTGIAGLAAIAQTNNGGLADTLVLSYTSAFSPSTSYALTISGVKDADMVSMFAPYVYNFTYNTTIAFDKKFISVKEDTGTFNIKLNLVNPSVSSVKLVVKTAPFSTATAADLTLATQTINLTGASATAQLIPVTITNDTDKEQDEYVVISLEDANGLSITGSSMMTVYIRDNDRTAPVATKDIELNYVASFEPNAAAGSTTEIVAHDAASQRLFMTSAIQSRLDIADFSNPANITLIKSIDMTPYGGITSVAVKNGVVAVASPNDNEQLNGSVVFFSTNGDFIKQVTVGALPDMVTFTPDGNKVLTANEGQPNDAYTVDPEGSVSVIDISGGVNNLTQANVNTLLFTSFNAQETALVASGVRKLKISSTLAQDFEPEYITVAPDNKKAWVTLQENNAIAEINLETSAITSVTALGTKDMSAFGNGFDASDNSGVVSLANWPVKAFYIPDGIANYTAGANRFLVTANEGDEKEYAGLNERTTVGASTTKLDSTKFPHAAFLKEDHAIGRLRITNLNGDTDGDGDFDQLYVNGARSFTIWDAATKAKVYDSGDDFELITSTDPSIKALFNADNENNNFKSRSRAKGPEPEGVAVATIAGQTFAFVGLERVGGVMVYNITDPAHVKFVDYKNSRSTATYAGDHAPEGIIFISGQNSPNGKNYVAVANEISGTIAVFEVINNIPPATVNFAVASAASNEDAGTKTVRINITPAAQENGNIVVKVANGTNVTTADYSTTPALSGDSIVVPVVANDTEVSFVVNISNDTLDEQDETITFTLFRASAGSVIGTTNAYELTIIDNDTTVSTGISKAGLLKERFRMYPNPNNAGVLHFSKAVDAELYDMTGKLIMKAEKAAEMNIADLAKGIYLVRVEGVLVQKLIKE